MKRSVDLLVSPSLAAAPPSPLRATPPLLTLSPPALYLFRTRCLILMPIGLTAQNYAELAALYGKHAGRGLEILGFPSNQFGSQVIYVVAFIQYMKCFGFFSTGVAVAASLPGVPLAGRPVNIHPAFYSVKLNSSVLFCESVTGVICHLNFQRLRFSDIHGQFRLVDFVLILEPLSFCPRPCRWSLCLTSASVFWHVNVGRSAAVSLGPAKRCFVSGTRNLAPMPRYRCVAGLFFLGCDGEISAFWSWGYHNPDGRLFFSAELWHNTIAPYRVVLCARALL